jgi:hypothetical protein
MHGKTCVQACVCLHRLHQISAVVTHTKVMHTIHGHVHIHIYIHTRMHTRCTNCQSSGLFPLKQCSLLADAVCVPLSEAITKLQKDGVTTIEIPPGR